MKINDNLIDLYYRLKTVKEYPLIAKGISNRCYTDKTHNKPNSSSLGVQFYEIDTKEKNPVLENKIGSFFKDDCLRFETSKGYHYVSFLITNLQNTLTIANHLTFDLIKDLSISDYYKSKYDCLILRISEKKHWFSNKIASPKPQFDKLIKIPKRDSNLRYSLKHMLYFKRLGIPDKVINLYPKKLLRNFNIATTQYHTSNAQYKKKL